MSSYGKTLTVEAKANTHLTHLEELVLTQGEAGYQLARSFLLELIKNLGGNSNAKVSTSVKWDGAPAMFVGRGQDGKFFVGTKSVFNAVPKLNYTAEDIINNHSKAVKKDGKFIRDEDGNVRDEDGNIGHGGLVDKLKRALIELPKLGIKNILQGDFMFDDSMLKKINIDGEPHYQFQPNTIAYSVPVNSELGQEISQSKFGIVFHTTYGGVDKVGRPTNLSHGADVNNLNKVPGIWFDDAFFTDDTGTVTLTKNEEQEIISLIKNTDIVNAKINYDILTAPINREVGKIATSESTMYLLNIYINREIASGKFLEDFKQSFEGFKNWYVQRESKVLTPKELKKLKSNDNRNKRIARVENKIQQTLNFFNSVEENILNLFEVSKLLFDAKNIFIEKYNNAVYNTKHFIDDGSGSLIATNPEGYVAVDNTGNGVKFIDRLEFSRANFAKDKKFAKESLNLSESFTVVFGSEHKITKPINEWLLELKSPEGTFININEKKVAANSTDVYNLIMSGDPITSFLKKPEYVKPAIAGAIQYHLNEQSLDEFSINDNPRYTTPKKKKNQVIALFPGAFRPPTRGHLFAATNLMNQADTMKVLISNPKSESSKRRVGTKEVTPEISKKIWELYGIPSENVQITDSPSPVRAVFEFLEDPMLAPPGTTIMLGCSTKGGDEARWDNAAAYAKKVRGDEIKVVTSACPPGRHTDDYEELLSALEDFARNNLPSIQKGKDPMNIHGSDMRHLALMALEGDQELTNLFKHFLPSNIDHEGVLKLLSSGPSEEVRESFSLPFLDALVEEVMDEIKLKKSKSKKKEEEEELEEMSTAGGSAGSNGSVEGPPRREMGKRDSGTMIRQ